MRRGITYAKTITVLLDRSTTATLPRWTRTISSSLLRAQSSCTPARRLRAACQRGQPLPSTSLWTAVCRWVALPYCFLLTMHYYYALLLDAQSCFCDGNLQFADTDVLLPQGLSAMFLAIRRRPIIRFQRGSDWAAKLAESLYRLTYKQVEALASAGECMVGKHCTMHLEGGVTVGPHGCADA